MELRNYLAVLRKRWMLVVGILVASVLVAAGATFLIPPTYEADTQLFVSTQTDAANPNQQLFQGGSFSQDRVKSYAQLATSPKVLEPVRQELGLTTSVADLAGEVTANVPTSTVLLDVRVTSDNAQTSADLTNAIGDQLGRVIEELETPASGPPSPVKVSILKQAVPADSPISPSLLLDLAIGVLVGLILGVGAALVRESLDVTIKGREDLARVTTLPVLATVVYDADGADKPITRGGLDDIRSEAFRQLRTNLQFAYVDDKPGVLTVTSALPGEGKSSVAGNLAMSLQQLGWSVCLVDGDLRRPSVARYFGLVQETGLTTALIGRVAIGDVVQSATPGLDVVTSGGVPPNPTELVASERMTTVLRELATHYDMVIVDAPPTLPVADAAALASRADGTLYVVQVGSTTRAQATQALENLEQVNAKLLGVVLNKAPARPGKGGYYDYSSTYRPNEQQPVAVPDLADDSRTLATDETIQFRPIGHPFAGQELTPSGRPGHAPATRPAPSQPVSPSTGAHPAVQPASAPQATGAHTQVPQPASQAAAPPAPQPAGPSAPGSTGANAPVASQDAPMQRPAMPATGAAQASPAEEPLPKRQVTHAAALTSESENGTARPSPRPGGGATGERSE